MKAPGVTYTHTTHHVLGRDGLMYGVGWVELEVFKVEGFGWDGEGWGLDDNT